MSLWLTCELFYLHYDSHLEWSHSSEKQQISKYSSSEIVFYRATAWLKSEILKYRAISHTQRK